MKENDPTIKKFRSDFDRNVFVIMRYRAGVIYEKLEATIRNTLSLYGLEARLAKDKALSDDLWNNIELYMKNCKYAIAIFEEIDEKEYNPNVSMELGYMYALGRRCLLLKDKRMPRLPTDICGKIYKDFDAHSLEESVKSSIKEWCENDLNLTLKDKMNEEKNILLYDSSKEGKIFHKWNHFTAPNNIHECDELINISKDGFPIFELETKSDESAGANKSIRTLYGKVEFEYKITSFEKSIQNIYFCMIPMQETGIGRSGIIEVGTDVQGDPRNPYSAHRIRYFVPFEHFTDDQWHQAELKFDFRQTPTAFYSIFAPRINEGCKETGVAKFLVRDVKIFSF